MACEVCAHCMSPVPRGSAAVREGWSYHKRCHKCYVCSETDLHNAEVFKGVIFCSGCAQRIFQGCSSARRAKSAKTKPRRQRERRRRERDARSDTNRVIEMARMGRSSTSSEHIPVESEPPQPAAFASSAKLIMQGSAEIGTTTDVTNEFLKELNCPIPVSVERDPPDVSTFEIEPSPKYKRHKRSEGGTPCSDLRIAVSFADGVSELGASTEIATMALRIHSGMTFKKSEIRMQPISATTELSTLSVVNQLSDELDSSNSSSEAEWDDLGSSGHLSDQAKRSFFKRLKALFQEEIVDHHRSGVKRLYSTVNKRNTPYRLGWLESSRSGHKLAKCKHCALSHSYRCMREQVMRSAGPTKSEMKMFRNKIKNTIVPPFLLRALEYNNEQAITMSAACGSERVDLIFSKKTRSV